MNRQLAYLLILLGVTGVLTVLYINSKYSSLTRTFSARTLLTSSWEKYKDKFINEDGRVIDPVGFITTSEGQSYAMLRAVWIDDKAQFDKSWKWTEDNLKRADDNLFGWRWGQKLDGSYGFLEGGGENSASDADSDIALALILASRRWSTPSYQDEAMPILKDIWDKEVDQAGGKNYLIAGNWAKGSDRFVLNPSYLGPYNFRIFAATDPGHDWLSLIDPLYELLDKVGYANLDKSKGSGMPPDWVEMEKASENLVASGLDKLSTDYSYDALRVPWRVALDWELNKEERAKKYLESNFKVLIEDLKQNGELADRYAHDGKRLSGNESPSMYATSLFFLKLVDSKLAQKVYEEKILRLYSNDQNQFKENVSYFDQNWLWFGTALFTGQINNL